MYVLASVLWNCASLVDVCFIFCSTLEGDEVLFAEGSELWYDLPNKRGVFSERWAFQLVPRMQER